MSALGRIGDRRAVLVILKILKNRRRSRLHPVAVGALGRLGDRRAVPALIAAVQATAKGLAGLSSAAVVLATP